MNVTVPPTALPAISHGRRRLLSAFALLPLAAALSACGGRNSTSAQPLPSVDLATFPDGLGRGFPRATLDGISRPVTLRGSGDLAPNFRLQLDDGAGLYLHDLQGRPILINFWATWCGPCRLEMPDIVHHARVQPELVVIAVNVQETIDPIQAFAADFAMTMPIARDEDGKIRDLYAVRGMPTSVFIDRAGVVQTIWTGLLTPRKLDELLEGILT